MSTKNNDKKTLKGSNLNLDSLVYGKVPPQARELEEAVLGAILMEKGAFDRAVEILKSPDMFYVDAHQRIYRAMMDLSTKAQPIDMLTICEQLKTTDDLEQIGGAYFISKLTNAVVSSAHIESHAEIVYKKYIKREQIRVCSEGLGQAYEDSVDAFDSLDGLQGKIGQLAVATVKTEVEHIAGSLVERLQRIESLRHRSDHLTGIPTGFPLLDLLTGGWQDTDLIIIAARPSVGKTAFALNLGRNAAASPTKPTAVALFSLEMSKGQLNDRLLSAESGIDLDKINRAKMSDDDMQRLYSKGVQPLAKYDLSIDDTPAMNIMELRAKARKWVGQAERRRKERNFLIIIDYLQLMTDVPGSKSNNREQEISNISRSLKALAKELKVPVIALSQLSREIEKQKREPQLSDLRESGAIEQDADMVMFLTRPDYQQNEAQIDQSIKDCADIHIKKHRNGDLAKIPMRTMLNIQRWMTDDQYEQYQRNLSYGNLRPLRVVNGADEAETDLPF